MLRRHYGWVMLLTVSFTEILSWGVLYYGFSVLLLPMQQALGWSPAWLSGGFSLALLTSGILAIPAGRWFDRHGTRAAMTAGSILASLVLWAWAHVHAPWQYGLVMVGLGAAHALVLYEPAFVIIATWFRRQRGRALTVLTFCGALASAVGIPLCAWLVEQLGWRAALEALALLIALTTITPHALVLRRRPADLGLVVDGVAHAPAAPAESSRDFAGAVRDPGFWGLSVAFAASQFATVAMTVQLIPVLVARGQSAASAAAVAGLFGLMSLLGRALLGPLIDRVPQRALTAGLLLVQLLGLLVLFAAPVAIGAYAYIVLFGMGSGTLTIVRAALLAARYGPTHYGAINGALGAVLTVARTAAPLGAGAFMALAGGDDMLLLALMLALGFGLVALRAAGPA
jgi:MFS family permease